MLRLSYLFFLARLMITLSSSPLHRDLPGYSISLHSSGVRNLLNSVLYIPMHLCRTQNASKSARNQLIDFKKFPKCYLFCSIRRPETTATCPFCQDSNFLQPVSKPLHLVTQADHFLPHVQGIPGSGHGEGAHCPAVPIRRQSPAY